MIVNSNESLDAECVQCAFIILDLAAHIIQSVSEESKTEKQGQFLSSLKKYFPSTIKDVEIQRFNIARILPSSINTEEALSTWFLYSDQINRSNIFYYLAEKIVSNSELEIKGLSLLAQMICKLDVASSYADGLTFFVLSVGCWDPVYNDALEENTVSPYVLKKILYFYVNAHLHHSNNRIIPRREDENFNILIEALTDLAYWLLQFLGTLDNTAHNRRRDFQSSVSTIVSPIFAHAYELTDRSTELSKFVNSFYESVKVGRPLEPLPIPTQCPSYLFPRFGYNSAALVEQKILVSVGFSIGATPYIREYALPSTSLSSHSPFDDDSAASPLWAYLTHDAIYFFSTEFASHRMIGGVAAGSERCAPVASSRPPVACLPLERCNVRQLLDAPAVAHAFTEAEDGRSMGSIIQLSGTTGRCIPFLEFNHQAGQRPSSSGDRDGDGWSACMPSSISYHESILLRMEPLTEVARDEDGDSDAEGDDELSQAWVDAVATAAQRCWQPSQLEHTLL